MGKRVREEDMTTEDEDEDVIEHKRPDPRKTRLDDQNLDVFSKSNCYKSVF